MSLFDRTHAISCHLLLKLFVYNLFRFRNIASYLSKVENFFRPRVYLAPSLVATGEYFHQDLWYSKSRVVVHRVMALFA